MNKTNSDFAQQLAHLASRSQAQRTGYAPKKVNVVLSDDTLIITLQEALTPAERALAATPEGSAQVQKFHRRLFADSTDAMRQAIERITGRQVREAVVEVETATGAIVHVFSTGAMVQVFLLDQETEPDPVPDGDSIERTNDDGLCVAPEATFQDESAPPAQL